MTSPVCTGSSILIDFFDALEARSIPYCVMGNTSMLPQLPVNDVDIVCDANSLSALKSVIDDVALRHGGLVAQILRHESCSFYYVLYLPTADGGGAYLKLDVCADYVSNARLLLTAAWLLEGRRTSGRGFFVCSPEREFAYYAIKKVLKGEAGASALSHLASLFASDCEACRQVLNYFWPRESASLIEQSIVAGSWASVAADIVRLRRELSERLPGRSLALGFAEVWRRVERVIQPTGFVVAVLGPDGSGKSTLIGALEQRLSALGRRSLRFHLMPPIAKQAKSGRVVTDPHGKAARGVVQSTLKLIYFVAAYNAGWLASIWLPRRQSAMIFFDRYYQDILADPARYRNGAPVWLSRYLGNLIPAPDLFLIVDVEPHVARARASEVSVDESARQFGAYRQLCAELANARLIDGNRPALCVAAQAEAIVVDAMARRLKKRGQDAPH